METVERGIYMRHRGACPRYTEEGRERGARCRCTPSYRAEVYNRATKRTIKSPWLPTRAAARAWRQDTQRAVRLGTVGEGRAPTIAEAADELIAGMESGAINSNRREPYAPATIYDYRRALENDVVPDLGGRRLDDHRLPGDARRLIERLQASDRGISGSRVANIVNPLLVIGRRAHENRQVAINPMAGLAKFLPAATRPTKRSRPTRVVPPDHIEQLLAPLTTTDRVIWGLGFYAGLRLGEIRGLRWSDIDYGAGLVHVRRAFDERSRTMRGPKYGSIGEVPLIPTLRELLMEQYLDLGQPAPEALVAPGRGGAVVTDDAIYRRRDKAWAGLDCVPAPPYRLHEARHSYQSMGHAAGWTVKQSTAYLRHKSAALNIDRYTHLLPGSGDEAAAKLQAFLDSASGMAATAEPEQADQLLAEVRETRRLLEQLLGGQG